MGHYMQASQFIRCSCVTGSPIARLLQSGRVFVHTLQKEAARRAGLELLFRVLRILYRRILQDVIADVRRIFRRPSLRVRSIHHFDSLEAYLSRLIASHTGLIRGT